MIPKTMKAAVVQGYGQPLKIEEVPVRDRITSYNVCYTKLLRRG